jgi:hypothetical protein
MVFEMVINEATRVGCGVKVRYKLDLNHVYIIELGDREETRCVQNHYCLTRSNGMFSRQTSTRERWLRIDRSAVLPAKDDVR